MSPEQGVRKRETAFQICNQFIGLHIKQRLSMTGKSVLKQHTLGFHFCQHFQALLRQAE